MGPEEAGRRQIWLKPGRSGGMVAGQKAQKVPHLGGNPADIR